MRALADGGWVTCVALALAIGLIAAVQGLPGWAQLATAVGIVALLPAARALDGTLARRARRAGTRGIQTPRPPAER